MRKIYSLLYLEKDISYLGWETDSTKLVMHHHSYQQAPTVELISGKKGKLEVFCWQWVICTTWMYPTSSKLAPELEEGEGMGYDKSIKTLPLFFLLFKGYIAIHLFFCPNLKNNKPHGTSWDFFLHSPDIPVTQEGKQHFTAPVESKLVFLATKCSVSLPLWTHTSLPTALTDPAWSAKSRNQKDAMPELKLPCSVKAP